jgi:HEAT repeat protein
MRSHAALLVVLLALPACVTEYESRPGVHRREQIEEMRYMRGQELLSRMTYLANLGEEAIPELRESADSDDWLVRSSVIWIFGAIGDRRNIPLIQERLTDQNAAVRYQAASTLAKLGDRSGYPLLVDGLADQDITVRFKCFQALKQVTGQDFGYAHDAAPEDRRRAVARWLDWLDGIRASAL